MCVAVDVQDITNPLTNEHVRSSVTNAVITIHNPQIDNSTDTISLGWTDVGRKVEMRGKQVYNRVRKPELLRPGPTTSLCRWA